MKKYDIFISYRRDGGSETAKMIRDSLSERGYRVFLDIESLRSGQFNTELYNVIDNSKDILVILPENGLDRCTDENDWVRLEIEHAKAKDKNIIPIFLKNFSFPDELPESLEFIKTQNGISANTDYYDAFIGHLVEFLKSKHLIPKSKRWIFAVIAVILAFAVVFGGIKLHNTYPRTKAEKNLVSEVITYMVPNMKRFDLATTEYQNALKKTVSYLKDESLYTVYDMMGMLDDKIAKISAYKNELDAVPSDLKSNLASSPFDVGNLEAMKPYITTNIEYYTDRLQFVRDYIVVIYVIKDKNIQDAERKTLMTMCELNIEDGDLFAEEMFYNINEFLLPVTNESALTDLKREHLPEMTSIYSKHLDFCDDLNTIRGKQDAIYNQNLKNQEEYEEAVDLLEKYTNEYKTSNK